MAKEINCPICDSEKINNYASKNGYRLYQCLDCDLVFVWPIPVNVSKIYGKQYFKANKKEKSAGYIDYENDKEPMKRVFENCLDEFEKLTKGRKVFDIGAATGYFLDLAKRRGWKTAGTEISEYAAELAKKKGHDIFCGDLFEKNITKIYDVVTMWDVLEHLKDPGRYLQSVNKLLVNGGVLAINTIDKGSLWAKFFGKKWHLIIPPEHLFYFSQKNLKILLKEAGFKIIKIKKIGKKFSLPYIFSILYSWQKLEIWHLLLQFFNKPFWRRFSIPINLRDNIFIIARKKAC